MSRYSIVVLVILLAACASAGNKVDRTHIGDLKDGVQNKAKVKEWFGEPYTIKTGLEGHPKGCVERWTFEYAKAQGFGTVTYSEILVVDFDKKGVVCDHAFSKSGAE